MGGEALSERIGWRAAAAPFCTPDARSSPRHARGLNEAEFLRPCGPLNAALVLAVANVSALSENLRIPAEVPFWAQMGHAPICFWGKPSEIGKFF